MTVERSKGRGEESGNIFCVITDEGESGSGRVGIDK